jgi:hypothetical protein
LKGIPKCGEEFQDGANVDRAQSQGISGGTDVLGADDRVLKGDPKVAERVGRGERRDLKLRPPLQAMPVDAEQEEDLRPGDEGLLAPFGQLLPRLRVFDLDDGIGWMME